MNRETKTITTPIGKHSVVLKTYITGREKREITSVYLSGGVDFDTQSQNIKGVNGDIVDKAQDVTIKVVVVSVNGKSENVVNDLLDMHMESYWYPYNNPPNTCNNGT